MISLLHELRFWISYDVVRYLTSNTFSKGNLAKIELENCLIVFISIYKNLFSGNLVLSHFYYCIGCKIQTKYVKYDEIVEIIFPKGPSFSQYLSGNTNQDIAISDGKDTHQGLGSITIGNGEFASASFKGKKFHETN